MFFLNLLQSSKIESRLVPFLIALLLDIWIVGPSAIGSEKGMPISTISAPLCIIVSKIGNILESTNIGKIAKEITEEINIDEMISKDGNIEDMFKGENMMNLFSIINSKIGSKLSSDEINKEDLVGEAGNICNEMQGNDLFNSILSEGFGDLGGLTDLLGAGGGLGGGLGGDLKNINLNSHNNNTNPTRERLQRKLNEKKGINVKKLNK